MRFLKSRAFKSLDDPIAANMANNFVRWCENQREPVTHLGLTNALGASLGFVTAQAVAYGDLRDAEIEELISKFCAAATMTGVHALADGPLGSIQEFDEIVGDMNARTFGFGMDGSAALKSFIHSRKKRLGQSVAVIAVFVGLNIEEAKTVWSGGPDFKRF